jgi:glycosyltransferase involved in cell wall biosynthesis
VSATAVRATALVVTGRDAEIRRRAGTAAGSLQQSGLEVEVRRPLAALAHALSSRSRYSCVVTCAAHGVGAGLRRAGIPWIAVHGTPWPSDAGWKERIESRLLRMADVAASSSPAGIADLHRRASANAVEIDPAGRDLARLVALARAWREPSSELRVLVIGPTNSPHVEDFAIALRERGADVFVAGLPWGGGLGPSVLPAAGIPVVSATWPATLWIRRLMRELRPAVVHAHWLPNAVSARRGGARPLVATAWGSDVYLASRRQTATYRWVLRRAEMALADSNELLSSLRRLGAPPSRSRVFSWGVDASVFSPSAQPKEELRRSLGIASGPMVLSARGLGQIYNPEVVIAAFDRLAERRPDLQLVLKHNSSEPPELPELRFPERVHVVGPQPRAVLADWFRAASVCVSLASTDSSPRSVWEAMACGCPCVVSDLPWARQELDPERHALLTAIEPGAVAGAIARVLDDDELAREMADAARSHIEAHHDRDREVDRMIELYGELAR